MEISKNVKYVGVNDHQVDLFEGQYLVPNGMAYNSYIILDEKTAVMDTVDGDFSEEWLHNIEQVLEGRTPDYLVIQHMEPDHSANIPAFLRRYPETAIVSTAMGFKYMEQFFPETEIAAEKRSHSCQWWNTGAWKSYIALCICTYGTLAGSYDDI